MLGDDEPDNLQSKILKLDEDQMVLEHYDDMNMDGIDDTTWNECTRYIDEFSTENKVF